MVMKVIINGALGKMGRLACETINNHPDFYLVASLSRADNLRKAIEDTKAQIVVDLTRADAVYKNTLTIIESNAHPVIGTSGLSETELQFLSQQCEQKQLGGLIVPNFSIGAILMMRFAAMAATYLSEVEIIEAHHQQKFDAPSGTAIKTAEMISKAQSDKKHANFHELLPGARGALHQGIPIHSLRLPGVLARQQVIFGNTGETLSITHDSIDRQAFMPGIILCCQKVSQLTSLVYGLEHIL